MADKALISEFTWRSLAMQKGAFPDMPHFIAPDDMASLLRQTQRKDRLFVHVMSLAVIAEDGEGFELFWRKLPKDAAVRDLDRCQVIEASFPIKKAKMLFLSARKFGAAKIGGQISADNRKAKSAIGAKLIEGRWGMPSRDWPTKVLLKEADISYNTAKTILPPRPIAQYNYKTKMKRKHNKNVIDGAILRIKARRDNR